MEGHTARSGEARSSLPSMAPDLTVVPVQGLAFVFVKITRVSVTGGPRQEEPVRPCPRGSWGWERVIGPCLGPCPWATRSGMRLTSLFLLFPSLMCSLVDAAVAHSHPLVVQWTGWFWEPCWRGLWARMWSSHLGESLGVSFAHSFFPPPSHTERSAGPESCCRWSLLQGDPVGCSAAERKPSVPRC